MSFGQAFLRHLLDRDDATEDQEPPPPPSGEEVRWLIGSTLLILGVAGLWMYMMLWH